MKKQKSNTAAVQTKEISTMKQSKPKKPFFKKWWFWIIVVGIVYSIATGGGVDTPEEVPQKPVLEETAEPKDEHVESVVTEEPEKADPVPEPEEAPAQVEPPEVAEPEPPVEEPKVEAPVVVTPVVTPVPEAPVVEKPPVVDTEPIEEMVWITATGSKYHNKPNCGNTQSARQVTRSQAEKSYGACKKCYG